MGGLRAAPVQFECAADVPQGGGLWALPALLAEGLLRHSRKHFTLPEGFYPLETFFLVLAFMALLRVRSLEALRYEPPGEWGQLLGLDRSPEVRTLRAKVRQFCAPPGVATAWSADLARDWLAEPPALAGVYYADGHVRVYHGQFAALPRRYVARQKLCLRGTTDYWVNALDGRPFFLVSRPADPGLLDVLDTDLIPRLLADAAGQPTAVELAADPRLHRFTVVFDRAGYSPKFFAAQKARRVAILARWTQENFLKYMREHYAIDRLVEHGTEPLPETTRVVNPARRRLESELRRARAQLQRDQAAFGALSLSDAPEPAELAAWETPKAHLHATLTARQARVDELQAQRPDTPRHLALKDLPKAEQFPQLRAGRKHFLDTIKLIAYRAETALVGTVREALARHDDGRALVRELMRTPADLHPDLGAKTLTVRLHPLSSRLQDTAARHLAEELTATETDFPGTDLRLVFAVNGPP